MLNGALCPLLSPATLASLPPCLHSLTINSDHMSSPHMFPLAVYLTCGWTKRSDRSWKPRWCICPSCRRIQPCFSTQTSTGESSHISTSQDVPCGNIFISEHFTDECPAHTWACSAHAALASSATRWHQLPRLKTFKYPLLVRVFDRCSLHCMRKDKLLK